MKNSPDRNVAHRKQSMNLFVNIDNTHNQCGHEKLTWQKCSTQKTKHESVCNYRQHIGPVWPQKTPLTETYAGCKTSMSVWCNKRDKASPVWPWKTHLTETQHTGSKAGSGGQEVLNKSTGNLKPLSHVPHRVLLPQLMQHQRQVESLDHRHVHLLLKIFLFHFNLLINIVFLPCGELVEATLSG